MAKSEIKWPYDDEQDAIRRANKHAELTRQVEAYWASMDRQS